MTKKQNKLILQQFRHRRNVQILFFKYLSYHYYSSSMISIKKLIIKDYCISDKFFEYLLWRANRILIFQREYFLVKQIFNDKTTQSVCFNNLFRQKGYFADELHDYYEKNNIVLDYEVGASISWLTGTDDGIEEAIYLAINPPKTENIKQRFESGGTYFID